MGIPHLITSLQPFAPRESLANHQVVIDGPGFAHHIYYICLSSSEGSKNAFEAAPSYSRLVKAAVAWLDAVRDSGVKIEKIYFDGFLPPSKLDTRLSRLAKSTTRLSQYHTKYNVPCRADHGPLADGTLVLFGNTAVRSCLGTLPPLPFLIPAVIEALGSSHYKDMVEVVPGEADSYCAKFVNEYGGTILTGDSDLLVHLLGETGAVTFFKDILIEAASGLSSLIYRPTAIADRLALPGPNGLQFLAFEMFMDTHGTFPKVLAQAKLKSPFNAFPEMFADFIKEYNLLPGEILMGPDREAPKSLLVLRNLDPRISEYALQFPSLARISGKELSTQAPENVHVFLHFIIDCPVRTNAWEVGSAIRQLAYGLINLIVSNAEQKFGVFEHRRQQNKSKGLELQLPSLIDIPEACTSLLKTLLQIKEKLPDTSNVDYWLAVAVYQEVEWAYSYAKPSLSEAIVRYSAQPKENFHQSLTWDFIHFLGQIHGCLYSLRILKQMISLLVSHDGTTFLKEVASLHQQLATLPDLSTLPSYGDSASLIRSVGDLEMTRWSREILGQTERESEAPADAMTAGKKGKRKRDKSSSIALMDRKKSSNPFELLAVE